MVRATAPGFDSVLTQVPISSFQDRLEWLVHVPEIQSPSQRYTVCFCYGPECLEDDRTWYTAGHVYVHQEEQKEFDGGVRGQDGAWFTPRAEKADKICSKHSYASSDLASAGIVYNDGQGDMVEFSCAQGFIDLQGPRLLRCIDGTWFEHPEQDPSDTDTLKPWNMHMPYCRWRYTSCIAPPSDVKGGSVTVYAGVARYACDQDNRLVVKGRVVEASSFIRWCTEAGDWRPYEAPTCQPWWGKQYAMPSTVPALTNALPETRAPAAASLIQLDSNQQQEDRSNGMYDAAASEMVLDHSSSIYANRALPTHLISSFAELGAKLEQDHTAGDGVMTSRRAKVQVDLEDSAGTELASASSLEDLSTASGIKPGILRIHPLQIQFTNDTTHRFHIDPSWITWNGTGDQIPDDAAASSFYGFSPGFHERNVSWSWIYAAAASIVVSLAIMTVAKKGKRADVAER